MKRHQWVLWILLGSSLATVPPVQATTRFFAVTGSNANPCTEAEPCLTAGPYEAGLQPGDRVLFKRGEVFTGKQFQLQPTRSGTAEAPITYGAYGNGDKPVLHSGDQACGGGGGADGIRAVNTEWLVVEDLELTCWGSALDMSGVRDLVVRRVTSTGGSSEACVHIRQRDGRSSERVLLEDVELAQCGVNSNGEGVYIGTNPGQEGAGDATADITLRRVSIHDRHHDEGVEIKNCARRVTIEDSRIVGAGASDKQGHGIAIAPSSADCPGNNGEHVIRRNVIETSAARGIHVGTGATVTHNLFLRNGHSTGGAGIWVEDLPGDHHPVVIERNAVIGSAGAAIQVQESATPHTTVTGNLAYGNGSGNSPAPERPCVPTVPTPPAGCPGSR